MNIPLADVAAQKLTVVLNNQNISLTLYQKSTGFYCDIALNDKLALAGVICQDMNRIIRNSYFGINTDFVFYDIHGSNDPSYPGIGTRYLLYSL